MGAKVGKIIIGQETTVPYPKSELEELKAVLEYDGVLADINKIFSIDKKTVTNIATSGKGRKKNVDSIRDYVKAFKKETA